MGFTKIWERYFLKETLKTFFLFLICFFGLYALIDWANHSRSFNHSSGLAYLKAVFLYYGSELAIRGDVLIPFAILLGTIRTLCKLNTNNELVAMMAGGVKMSRLLRPFLFLGLLFTALSYFSMQYVVPMAAKTQNILEGSHHKKRSSKFTKLAVENMILEDGSTLLFQRYDAAQELFFDVYWVRSIDDLFKIKYLYPSTSPPTGYAVDHLERGDDGQLLVVSREAVKELADLKFEPKTLVAAATVPEDMSLSQLWERLPETSVAQSEKEARLVSTFHRKLALPWLCLLAVVAPAPFCLRFSRNFPAFIVYAGSLFGMILVYIVLDAVHVLGRRQLVDPLYALWTPLLLFFLIFGWRYVRVR